MHVDNLLYYGSVYLMIPVLNPMLCVYGINYFKGVCSTVACRMLSYCVVFLVNIKASFFFLLSVIFSSQRHKK